MNFAPAPLPGGQRFYRFEKVLHRDRAHIGIRSELAIGPLAVGDQDLYFWTDEGWQAFRPEEQPSGVLESEFDTAVQYEFALEGRNGPTPRFVPIS